MKTLPRIIISLIIPVLIWAVSWYATASGVDSWFLTLNKPSFNPPSWLFWPVWTILYLMIGYSFFQIWTKFWEIKKVPTCLLVIYWVQLFLNFMWSITFFGMQNPGLWVINIALLWVMIIINIVVFYKQKKSAGLILIPYLCWVSFASVLNYAIYSLN